MTGITGMSGTIAEQLRLALDLLRRRQKKQKFVAHCCGEAYREEAQRELAATEVRIEALVLKLSRAA